MQGRGDDRRRPLSEWNRRLPYLLGAVLAMLLGLASRRYAAWLPRLVAEYAGDTLWAAMLYGWLGLLTPRLAAPRRGSLTLVISCVVEASQLIRRPWLDAIRHTTLGSLVLGQGFLWTDLVCYAAGALLAVAVDLLVRRVVS